MSNNTEQLERQIESLKSELAASMRREEELRAGKNRGGMKAAIKNTALYKIAADPNSKIGKIVRGPRTLYRLATNPQVAKDLKRKRSRSRAEIKEEPVFVPIELIYGVGETVRVNVVMREMDEELVRDGTILANKKKAELRIITTGEAADPMKYRGMVKKKLVPKAEKVSFYSSFEQGKRSRPFKLEIAEGDIFLSRGRRENGEE